MSDTRTIYLCTDGRFTTLARHSVVTREDIDGARASGAAQGIVGFLATMDGDYYGRGKVVLTKVESLGADDAQWDDAVAALIARRKAK